MKKINEMSEGNSSLLNQLEDFRIQNGLKKKDLAALMGANSAIMHNWYMRDSLPRKFVGRARELIELGSPPQSIESRIVEKFKQLDPDNQQIMLNLLDRLADQ